MNFERGSSIKASAALGYIGARHSTSPNSRHVTFNDGVTLVSILVVVGGQKYVAGLGCDHVPHLRRAVNPLLQRLLQTHIAS